MESGLSQHSLNAYGADLRAFSRYLHGISRELLDVDQGDLLQYMAQRSGQVSARTSARSLSSLRRFYRWLLREGMNHCRSQRTDQVSPPASRASRFPERERN